LNSKEIAVTDHVYKLVELVGSSTTGIEDAIERAIAKTSDSVRHMRWFEVEQIRGHLENGKLSHYQVTIKAGFTLEDEGETLQP
jgi:flavin-binding protein dodecin